MPQLNLSNGSSLIAATVPPSVIHGPIHSAVPGTGRLPDLDDLHPARRPALIGSMTPEPHLTRRRDPNRKDCSLIYFGDVHCGTVADWR